MDTLLGPTLQLLFPTHANLRRWVQHVLPRGFLKIRHAGLLANRGRTERLELCRALLALWTVLRGVVGVLAEAAAGSDRSTCPACGSVQWGVAERVPPLSAGVAGAAAAAPDTS